MPRYLLVDDASGRVLAEIANPQQAMRLLAALDRSPHGDPNVSLVRLNNQQGDLLGVTSRIAMRPLAPISQHPSGNGGSPARRGPRRSRRRRRQGAGRRA